MLLPVRRRLKILSGLMRAELVVGRPLFRILEGLICLGDFLEFFFRPGFLGNVGMVFARQTPIGLLDRFIARAAFESEDGVIVFVFHTYRRIAALFPT